MKFILSILIVVIGQTAFSQKEKPQNYRKFDEKIFHFGFMLGANTANFRAVPTTDAYESYGPLLCREIGADWQLRE